MCYVTRMKTLEVGCAIITQKGKILIAQRKPGTHLGGFWEFPGGKLEKGENLGTCLEREVFEELYIRIRPRQLLCQAEHQYPDRKVVLYFTFCDWLSRQPVKRDCLDFRWVTPEELRSFRFPPADADILNVLLARKAFYFPK